MDSLQTRARRLVFPRPMLFGWRPELALSWLDATRGTHRAGPIDPSLLVDSNRGTVF